VTREAREALRAIPLLSALEGEDLASLLDRCVRQRVRAGEEIFSPEDPARAFFVILSGQIKVFHLSSRGDEQILHLYGPGQTFGEAAMWARGRFPAFAAALKDTVLLRIDRDTLLETIRDRPEMALAMLAGLSLKLREFSRLIEQLALKEVPSRLAQVLLQLSDEAGSASFTLGHSKRELAAQIGTIAETLSRALRRLSRQGLIRVEAARITILDREGLEDLAG